MESYLPDGAEDVIFIVGSLVGTLLEGFDEITFGLLFALLGGAHAIVGALEGKIVGASVGSKKVSWVCGGKPMAGLGG